MKKFIKWGGIGLLIPVSLFLILSILLYLPPIQNFVVGQVTQGASEATGMDIQIERVSLSFPLNLVVHQTTVVNKQDTVLDVNRLKVKVQLWPLIHKKVEVDGLELLDAKVNTGGLLEGISVNGQLRKCYIESHGVDLSPEMAIINKLELDDTNLAISMADTTAADTTTTDTIPWKIKVEKVDFRNVSLALSMPLDSLYTDVSLGKAELRDALVDLKKSAYQLDKLNIEDGGATFIMGASMSSSGFALPAKLATALPEGNAKSNGSHATKGFNPSHISLSDIEIDMNEVYYEGNQLRANIRKFNMKEQSGLEVIGTKGKLEANDQRISIPTFEIKTRDSKIQMSAKAEWPISKINEDAAIKAKFSAHISKNDIFKFVPDLPEDFMTTFPEAPVEVEMGMDGSLNKLNLTAFDLIIPKHMSLTTQGLVTEVLNDKNRKAYLEMKGEFPNMAFLRAFLGDAVIPTGTSLEGVAQMNRDTLRSNLSLLTPVQGKVWLDGKYTLGQDAYEASMRIDSLNLHAFLPKDSLYHLTAHLTAKGEKFDFLEPTTWMNVEGGMKELRYGQDYYRNINLSAELKEGKANAKLDLNDYHFKISSRLNAQLSKQEIAAELTAAVKRLDLSALNLTDKLVRSAQDVHVKVKTDMNQRHKLRAEIRNNKFTVDQQSFTTKDVLLGADLTGDSIMSYANAGDLTFMFQSGHGIDAFLDKVNKVTTLIGDQWSAHALNHQAIRSLLPDAHLRVWAGEENPVSSYLASQAMGFKEFKLHLDASPEKGVSSISHLYKLHTDSLTLDTIGLQINHEAEQFVLKGKVKADRNKFQEGFTIGVDGNMGSDDAKLMVEYFNEKNERGAQIGIGAKLQEKGVVLRMIPERPTLVYRPFHVNTDNFVSINDDGHIEANLGIYDDKSAGLHLYSTPDSTAQNDLTLILNKIDLAEMKKIVPYMPDMAGLFNMETHYVQPVEGISMASIEAGIDSLKYNQEPMGNWGLSAVYLPKEHDEHCIDGYVMRNDEEIASLYGSYFTQKGETEEDWLKATLNLSHFPLSLSNAFVSRKLAVLTGHLDGEMSVNGSTSHPRLNGSINLDDVNVFLPPASMNLRFDKQPIEVANSKLNFNKYKIYTLSDSPFTIDGNVDFSNLSAMMIDLKMVANDFELINGKKTKESLVYGKLYIDLASSIQGTPDNLKVRGAANILGKSDFTYILKDSPLTVEDRLNDMVTFVNFNDTVPPKHSKQQSVTLGGIDVLMALHIDQAVQGRVDLNANGSNYMLMEGGGDLSFQYTPEGNMYMNGRYSLMSGEMKYEMPVIPLKTFKIKEGSFIEWTGNMMNPNLNIQAYEKVRSTVSRDGKNSRMVTFNVGVNLTNRLENLGFTFTLEAPEDGGVQDELAAMSAAEKNKLAVTMLVTGLYIAESNAANGLDANNALNSFLQSEINNIAGNALKTIDVNFGMEKSNQGETGSSRMDYNFQFAKRFWNNRFRVVIGGKISTGNTANQNDSFIDNVSLEYRLDNSGTRYVKIFHDRKYANVLEGEIIETGAGIVLRKKVSRVGELFIFKRKKKDEKDKAKAKKAKDDAEAKNERNANDEDEAKAKAKDEEEEIVQTKESATEVKENEKGN